MSDKPAFTMMGDADAAACVDDSCLLPTQASGDQVPGDGSVRSATTAPNEAMSASASTNAL